ncbi:Fc.00g042700.m01.CDS01 [Cosmosporella sp. VM-42]
MEGASGLLDLEPEDLQDNMSRGISSKEMPLEEWANTWLNEEILLEGEVNRNTSYAPDTPDKPIVVNPYFFTQCLETLSEQVQESRLEMEETRPSQTHTPGLDPISRNSEQALSSPSHMLWKPISGGCIIVLEHPWDTIEEFTKRLELQQAFQGRKLVFHDVCSRLQRHLDFRNQTKRQEDIVKVILLGAMHYDVEEARATVYGGGIAVIGANGFISEARYTQPWFVPPHSILKECGVKVYWISSTPFTGGSQTMAKASDSQAEMLESPEDHFVLTYFDPNAGTKAITDLILVLLKDSITEPPAAKDPVAEDPVREDSVAEDPAGQDPGTETLVVEDPVVQDPVGKDIVTGVLAGKDLGLENLVLEVPLTEDPAVEDSVEEDPTLKALLLEDLEVGDLEVDSGVGDPVAPLHSPSIVDEVERILLTLFSDADGLC